MSGCPYCKRKFCAWWRYGVWGDYAFAQCTPAPADDDDELDELRQQLAWGAP